MNKKQGLDYFPFDITFFTDDKIRFMSALFGTKGEAITIRLLCKIYREGYFIDWNEDTALLFSADVGDGCKIELVNEVISELVKRGFFDKEKYDKHSVLTSKGIQKRFFEAAVRRKEVTYNPNLILIDPNKYVNLVKEYALSSQNVNILESNDDILKQRKGKERKVEESKGEYILSNDNIIESTTSKVEDITLHSETIRINYNSIVALYHQYCPRLPKVQMVTEKRKKAMKVMFLKDNGISGFEQVFRKLGASDFCCGVNKRNWTASFDWILNPNNWVKVLEGKYDSLPKCDSDSLIGNSSRALRSLGG